MQVNHSLRRIASLSAFVLAIGVTSASQAGIIPWVYDAVFGPVRYRSYGDSPYAVSYRQPVMIRSYAPMPYGYSYAPSPGWSSCSTSYYAPTYYAPVSYAMPSVGCGNCGPVVMAPSSGPCGTVTYASSTPGCLTGCSVLPATATSKPAPPSAKSAWTKKAPESDQDTPTTVTPSAGIATDDGLGTSPRSRGKAKVEAGNNDPAEGNRPASGEEEPTILKRNRTPAKITEPDFQPPLENVKPKEIKKPNELEFDDDKKAPGEAKSLLPRPTLNLDAKIAWRTEPQRTRVAFHAKLAKASVTRRTPGADFDWTPIVAKVTGTQFVKK